MPISSLNFARRLISVIFLGEAYKRQPGEQQEESIGSEWETRSGEVVRSQGRRYYQDGKRSVRCGRRAHTVHQ